MNLAGPVQDAAPGLLGAHLAREGVVLRITEVEAYGGPGDSASHARHGRTPRNAPMWGPPGRAYLYFCYGMHWMLNVVTGPEGEASAVLIRGAEVVSGLGTVLARRRTAKASPQLCAGPGKVAQALGLDRAFDGHDLLAPGGLELRPGPAPAAILAGPRLGIAFATPEDRARPWRFADGDSRAVLQRAALLPR
ncbi:DNA-3-methyladenine glycosylase [Geothrix alkalitolerans]|uniref:DNA-3-methyladenine glycosylase n=1 Tax=Geothrix alkalitolerans TaxID=2922724 RepID=UPI001FAFA06F|nr:DNA-3-methyladenine glycosylase [Geothrix alkalitolerans]